MIKFYQKRCARSVKMAEKSHKGLKACLWGMAPYPEHFDHHIDLYYQWRKNRNPLWLERGIFGRLAIKENAEILDIASGDGFNAAYFYSLGG